MLLSKAVLEGLKHTECECGIGDKNSPICYITEQDPIQEALETKHQPMSFKLRLPSVSEMRIMRWASVTPVNFLIHVQGVIHTIKEMKLDLKFQEAVKAVESVTLEVDLAKMIYKDELQKGKRDNAPQQAIRAGKATPDKAKQLKKAEGGESSHATVVAAK